MEKLRAKILVSLIAMVVVCLPDRGAASVKTEETGGELTTVTLQLKWKHQFQFAGYYAAVEKGYYREAGLNVHLVEAVEGGNPADEVIRGQADFGIAMSDLITLRAKGFPVVALASIYQHSPLVLLSLSTSGIENVHDLKGKRIALEHHAEELLAYFESERVRTGSMTIFPHKYNISNLLSGEVDAVTGYSTDEPFILQSKGLNYNIISPRAGGIDFYGDTLFTTESQINKNPDKVRSFIEASLKGWKYAMDNSGEMIELILQKYSKRHTREHLQFEAEKTKQLIMADVVEIGYINKGRWEYIAGIFKKLHIVPEAFSLEGFIYDRKKEHDDRPFYVGIFSLFAVCLVTLFIVGRVYRTNKALAEEIGKRHEIESMLKENERKLSTLLSNLPGIAYRCLNDEAFTMQFVSNGCKELTGYNVSALLGNKDISYSEIIHPDDRPHVNHCVDSALENDEPFTIVYRIITKEGRVKWVWEQGREIPAGDNGLLYLEGFITDITQQKVLEKEVETLSGLLPLCAHCKKIRDDRGYWNQIESYISKRSNVDFSHSICPDCLDKYYPDFSGDLEKLEES